MRKRKRYESASQLEALIDKCRKEQRDNAAHYERLKDTYTGIYQWMAVQEARWDDLTEAQQEKYRNEYARALEMQNEAERLWKSQSRFETRLGRLKATLAALQTDTFQFVEDRSVTLQKVS